MSCTNCTCPASTNAARQARLGIPVPSAGHQYPPSALQNAWRAFGLSKNPWAFTWLDAQASSILVATADKDNAFDFITFIVVLAVEMRSKVLAPLSWLKRATHRPVSRCAWLCARPPLCFVNHVVVIH